MELANLPIPGPPACPHQPRPASWNLGLKHREEPEEGLLAAGHATAEPWGTPRCWGVGRWQLCAHPGNRLHGPRAESPPRDQAARACRQHRSLGWQPFPRAALHFRLPLLSLHQRSRNHGEPTLLHSFPPTHGTSPRHRRHDSPRRLISFPGSIQLTQALSQCRLSPARREVTQARNCGSPPLQPCQAACGRERPPGVRCWANALGAKPS